MNPEFENYKSIYEPMLHAYAKQLLSQFEPEAYDLIPQNFVPQWGCDYFKSELRIAFVGLETYRWGNMKEFLKEARRGDVSPAYDMSAFQDLEFLNWNNTHRHTFWGFNSFFLGALYGLENWEVLKWGQHKEILKAILWGNATSVERWEKCVEHGAKDKRAWNAAKNESLVFDDIRLLQKACKPHAALLLCGKRSGRLYLRNCSLEERKPIWTGDGLEIYRIGNMHAFHAYHPTAMKFNGGAKHYADLIREKMIEYRVFRPLPQCVKDDSVSKEYIQGLMKSEFRGSQPNTFDVVLKIAVLLRKQESLMPVPVLAKILNGVGCRTNLGNEYTGGRGMYRMLHHFYDREGLPEEEKDSIAMSFVTDYGSHPWEK